MIDVAAVVEAQDGLRAIIAGVEADQWALATPCPAWTVRDLIVHLVEGSAMSEALLAGASGDEVRAMFGVAHDDLVSEGDRRFAVEAAAFGAPGASESVVHHPGAGDVSGSAFFGMRLADYTLHTWDLARALGLDETLPERLVRLSWGTLEPFAPFIAQIGMFGDGPSGSVGEDAPLQVRLLDLSGRRP